MVARQQEGHRLGMLLCDFGATFDVGEEERDSAGGQITHGRLRIKIRYL
jgi:hypothetical protein